MFSIEHPILFSLIIVLILPIVIYLAYNRWRSQVWKQLGNDKNLKRLLTNFGQDKKNRRIIVLIAALFFMILAAVNFRKSEGAQSDMAKGLDILVALDVSKSMLANDVKPSRLEKAKIFIDKVLSQLANDQVGLLVFAGKAYIQAPLTNDYNMVKMMLENAHPSQVPHMGTDISDPIYWSNELFDKEEMKYKVLLLISDGEDHNDNALAMAEAAKESGIVIMTVGIGSSEGAPLMMGAQGQAITDENGEVVISKLNEELLKNIAQTTNGAYVHLDNVSTAADNIVSAINKMEKKDISIQNFSQYRSYFSIFALLALILLIIEYWGTFQKKTKPQLKTMGMLLILSLSLGVSTSFAQNKNIPLVDTVKSQSYVYKGNQRYIKQDYDSAIVWYQKALESHSHNGIAFFNMGNSFYQKADYESARIQYANAIKTGMNVGTLLSYSFYNSGNTYLAEKKYKEAIQEYIEALKLNPDDMEAKFNLSYALKKMKEQDNQNNQDNQNQQNQNDQQNQDSQDNNDNNSDSNNNPDNQQKDKNQQDSDKNQQNNKQQRSMNRDQMNATLNSISNNEKNIQKNKNKDRGQAVQSEKDW